MSFPDAWRAGQAGHPQAQCGHARPAATTVSSARAAMPQARIRASRPPSRPTCRRPRPGLASRLGAARAPVQASWPDLARQRAS